MRLLKLQEYIKKKDWKYTYTETNGLGSLDFEAHGVSYHVWEFLDGEYGAESNIYSGGRQKDYLGDYEEQLIAIMDTWK